MAAFHFTKRSTDSNYHFLLAEDDNSRMGNNGAACVAKLKTSLRRNIRSFYFNGAFRVGFGN